MKYKYRNDCIEIFVCLTASTIKDSARKIHFNVPQILVFILGAPNLTKILQKPGAVISGGVETHSDQLVKHELHDSSTVQLVQEDSDSKYV